MNCLRCGREAGERGTFCAECLQTVRVPLTESPYLSTRIILPPKKAAQQPKKSEKKRLPRDKTEKNASRRPSWIIAVLAVLCVTLCAASLLLVKRHLDLRHTYDDRVSTLEAEHREMAQELDSYRDQVKFYSTNIVVVQKGKMLYHSYGCKVIKSDSIYAYTIEEATARGYVPCAECR